MYWKKFLSRRFIITVATFLVTLAAGLKGVVDPTVCLILSVVSGSIFTAMATWDKIDSNNKTTG